MLQHIAHAMDSGYEPEFDGLDETRMQENFAKIKQQLSAEQLDKINLNTAVTADQLTELPYKETATAEQLSAVENSQIDLILKDQSSLVGDDEKWFGFYARFMRRFGIDTFVQLCAQAKQEGKNPPKYLSWLMKNHETTNG